jgi:hypothetical protein
MNNSNKDLSNCRKLLALLDSTFKGAVFGDVKVDDLSHSLLKVIELATPPAAQRKWVELTDDEKLHIEIMGGKSDVMLAKMIETKLKERNV